MEDELIFVSHSWQDTERLYPLVRSLKQRRLRCWFDADEVSASDSIPRAMNDALSASTRLLIGWSQSANGSPHVWNELDAFYMKEPHDGRILFLKLDSTPVPTLYCARRYLDARDLGLVAVEIDAWLTHRDVSAVRTEPADSREAAMLTVEAFPRGPAVDGTLIKHSLITAYARRFPSTIRALSIIREANELRRAADPADPRQVEIAEISLPNLDVTGAEQYWFEVFEEARLLGPRMVAALLLIMRDDDLPSEARSVRARIFASMRAM